MRWPNRLILFALGLGFFGGTAEVLPARAASLEYEDGIDAISEIRLSPDAVMLKLQLDGFQFDPILIGYTRRAGVLLPLGQISQLLGLAIAVSPRTGLAEGFVLNEDRTFELNVKNRSARLQGEDLAFKKEHVEVLDDDIYVSAAVLSTWLPVNFSIDMQSASVIAKPREPLPIQQRLQREKRNLGGADFTQHYPKGPDEYFLIEHPYLDLSLTGEEKSDSQGNRSNRFGFGLYGAADLLYHTTTFYLIGEKNNPLLDYRVAMGRKDTDSTLLGPLQAHQYQFGDIDDAAISSISQTRHTRGATVSNFPLYIANQLDHHTFRGDLPEGWDVELHHNGALIAYHPSDSRKSYQFDNIPLYAGVNRFELIFYGPQGQTRSEKYTFLLDDSYSKPGTFYYRFTGGLQNDETPGFQRETDRAVRGSGHIDLMLLKPFTATLQGITYRLDERERFFGKAGLRANWRALLGHANYIRSNDGGQATEAGAQLGFGWINFSAGHSRFREFTSEVFQNAGDHILHRSDLRFDTLPISNDYFPVSFGQGGFYELYESGNKRYQANNRISANLQRTSLSNNVQWNMSRSKQTGDDRTAEGSFYIGRRIFELGLSGTLQYLLFPEKKIHSGTVNTEWRIGEGYFASLGAIQTFALRRTAMYAGVAKDMGDFSTGLNGKWSDHKDWAINLVISVGIGRDRYQSGWFAEARPIGNTGAVAPRVFVDANQNGKFDTGEKPVAGVAFFVNGASSRTTTGDNGHAYLGNLPAYTPVEISVSPSSLPDAAMFSVVPGASFLPRPGHTATIDFPVLIAGEIDGTVVLQTPAGPRELANITMELINDKGRIVKREKTAFDGYYWIQKVPPGNYTLRPAPSEVGKLKQEAPLSQRIAIRDDGTVVNGADFVVGKKTLSLRNKISFRPKPAAEPPTDPILTPVPVAVPPPVAPAAKLTLAQSLLLSRIEAGESVIIAGIDFLPGTSLQKMGALNKLQDIVAIAEKRPDLKIELLVHADMVGGKEEIQDLSDGRARTLERYLRSKNSKITASGVGNTKPIALGFSFKGKEKNNRVEAKRGDIAAAPSPTPAGDPKKKAAELNQEGMAAFAAEKYDSAIPLLKQAAELSPNDKYWADLGQAYYISGDAEEAEKAYRNALKISANNADAHLNLGLILIDKGDTNGAKAAFQNVLRINPNHPMAGTVKEMLSNFE